MTDIQKRIVLEFAEHDMKAQRVAKELDYHINTVDYHLRRIHQKTGLNPKCFYDLVELLMIVNGEDEE